MSALALGNETQLLMEISSFSDFENDIVPLLKESSVKKNVESNEARYRMINVADSMKKLEAIGQLLSLAFAGTKGYASNAIVVELLCKYQNLATNSQLACNRFLRTCMQAQEYHKTAIQFVSKEKTTQALKALAMVCKYANEMIGVSDDLVNQSQVMVKLAEDAIVATSKDEHTSLAERAKIEQMLVDLSAEKEKLESKKKALEQQIKDAVENEKKAVDATDTAQTRAFIAGLVSSVLVPLATFGSMAFASSAAVSAGIGATGVGMSATMNPKKTNENDSETQPGDVKQSKPPPETDIASSRDSLMKNLRENKAKMSEAKRQLADKSIGEEQKLQLQQTLGSYESDQETLKEELKHINEMQKEIVKQANNQAMTQAAREARYHLERVSLQEIELEANADLAAALERLKGARNEKNSLDAAVKSLGFACKALGQITVIFQNTRVYWQLVKEHCEDLASMTNGEKIELVADESSMLIEAITSSWYSWIALGNINYTALLSLNVVIKKLNYVMSNLPTADEAQERCDELITWFTEELIKDKKQLENITK